MYEAQRVEENTTSAVAIIPLIRGVLQVWEEGSIAADEALRAVHGILQRTWITPSGTQLRSTRSFYSNELPPAIAVQGYGALAQSAVESRAETFSGSHPEYAGVHAGQYATDSARP